MSYESIKTQLVATVSTVNLLNHVYDHEPKEIAKYPAATVTAVGHRNKEYDTSANRRVFQFHVRCYYRTEDAQSAETELIKVADALISAIESNYTLGGSCDRCEATEGRWYFVERELPVRYFEILVSAIKRVNR
jgi:hypothetical protein